MIQIHPLSQTDPRWKDSLLGFDSTSTIGSYGCLLTCLAMAANALGSNETPASLNDKMKAINGFIGSMVKVGAISTALPGIKLGGIVQCNNQQAPVDQINAQLDAGLPVIVEVDYSPKPGLQNHWVLLYGRSGSDYLLYDPYPYPVETKDVTLTSRYGFAGSPKEIITSVVYLLGSAQTLPVSATQPVAQPAPPQPTPKPIRKNGDMVYAAVDELALRMNPYTDENNLIRRLPVNTRLVVLEAADQEKAKIGQVNAWLNVQETGEGYEGYVAAWYVTPNQVDPAQPETSSPVSPALPVTGPGQVVVYVTAPSLAFRNQPVVTDASLIRWVPANTQFLVLDPPEQAATKIGIESEWLQVKDVSGQEGYIAGAFTALTSPGVLAGVRPKEQPSTSGPKPQSNTQVVRPTVDGLALRSQSVITPNNLIKREPLEADLALLEPAEQARQKIGVVNQWVKVRDIQGTEGYVAAWYVA